MKALFGLNLRNNKRFGFYSGRREYQYTRMIQGYLAMLTGSKACLPHATGNGGVRSGGKSTVSGGGCHNKQVRAHSESGCWVPII